MGMAQQAGGLNANALFEWLSRISRISRISRFSSRLRLPQQTHGNVNVVLKIQESSAQAAEVQNPHQQVSGSAHAVPRTQASSVLSGSKKPEEVQGWTCSCGAVNKGKFCAECGSKSRRLRFIVVISAVGSLLTRIILLSSVLSAEIRLTTVIL